MSSEIHRQVDQNEPYIARKISEYKVVLGSIQNIEAKLLAEGRIQATKDEEDAIDGYRTEMEKLAHALSILGVSAENIKSHDELEN